MSAIQLSSLYILQKSVLEPVAHRRSGFFFLLYDVLCLEGYDIIKAMYTHGVRSLEEIAYVMDSLVNGGRTIFTVRLMRV